MSIRVADSSNGNNAMLDKLASANFAYLGKYKAALQKSGATNPEHKQLLEDIQKFNRDTSKQQRFVVHHKDAIKSEDARLAVATKVMEQICKGNWSPNSETNTNEVLRKAGFTTTLGYNFIDLRGPANLLYPVNTPFRDQMPRLGAVNGGVGTQALWKSTRVVGSQYAGVPEGQRAQVAVPDENNFAATYHAIGIERNVTVEAEWAGEGFTGNLADEHIRGLQELFLQEEGILLLGNDGTGSLGQNGFLLATAPAPVGALTTSGGLLPTTTKYTAFVVLLTAMGNPQNAQYGYQAAPTVAAGLVPSFAVTAPGTGASITYNGGMSAVSAASNSLTTANAASYITWTVQPASTVGSGGYPNGTFGFAWYISNNGTPTTANAYLTAITQFGSFKQTADSPVTGQTASATGLSTDHSSQATDFTGLLSWAATYGYWKDLQGAQLTSAQGGQCSEVEAALEYFFQNYQAGVDAIWGSPDAIKSLQNTILKNGSATASGYNIFLTKDEQDNIIGGLIVSGYQSRYAVDSPMGANVIPMKMHPMLPTGTLFFDITKNPYPHSRIPYTRAVALMRDYYGYEWPAINRAWAFGTYANEAIIHYTPWLTGVITGIGQS